LGFTGSYEIVKRKVKALKDEYQQLAYIRFETEEGYQAQVDFGEFQVVNTDGTIDKYFLFSMILGYSRKMYVELIGKCDLEIFLDYGLMELLICYFAKISEIIFSFRRLANPLWTWSNSLILELRFSMQLIVFGIFNSGYFW